MLVQAIYLLKSTIFFRQNVSWLLRHYAAFEPSQDFYGHTNIISAKFSAKNLKLAWPSGSRHVGKETEC